MIIFLIYAPLLSLPYYSKVKKEGNVSTTGVHAKDGQKVCAFIKGNDQI